MTEKFLLWAAPAALHPPSVRVRYPPLLHSFNDFQHYFKLVPLLKFMTFNPMFIQQEYKHISHFLIMILIIIIIRVVWSTVLLTAPLELCQSIFIFRNFIYYLLII